VLPALGDPNDPLPDEPGHRLRSAAWLGADELLRLATPKPAVNSVQALYALDHGGP
jgi:hypothetical protein